MQYRERTPKKWKVLLLIGRPVAFIGILLVGFALVKGGPEAGILGGCGVFLMATGVVAAWAGKIGTFWFHG